MGGWNPHAPHREDSTARCERVDGWTAESAHGFDGGTANSGGAAFAWAYWTHQRYARIIVREVQPADAGPGNT